MLIKSSGARGGSEPPSYEQLDRDHHLMALSDDTHAQSWLWCRWEGVAAGGCAFRGGEDLL